MTLLMLLSLISPNRVKQLSGDQCRQFEITLLNYAINEEAYKYSELVTKIGKLADNCRHNKNVK